MPAPLLGQGFDDLLLTNLVTILQAFSAQQAGLSAGVAFRTERDRMTAPDSKELESGPIVSLYATGSNPAAGGSRDHDLSTCTVQCDMYVAALENLSGGGDKSAMARLYYLKDQVRAALFAKSATDLGFAFGGLGKKRWGRFQMSPQPVESELWICAGSWTFEIDYTYDAQDIDLVKLTTVSIQVDKDNAQAPSYVARWSGLYTVQT